MTAHHDAAQPPTEVLKVRVLTFLEHEVYTIDDALQAGIAALPEGSVPRQVLSDVLLTLRTAELRERHFPAGFITWVAEQVESGAVDRIVAAAHETGGIPR